MDPHVKTSVVSDQDTQLAWTQHEVYGEGAGTHTHTLTYGYPLKLEDWDTEEADDLLGFHVTPAKKISHKYC